MIRYLINTATSRLQRFRADESGSGTLEFMVVIIPFMMLFTSAYEGGVLSTRHVMLERAMDRTVRDVRIGRIPKASNEVLTERICEYARIIPDCEANMRLDMEPMDPRNWDPTKVATIDCVDRDEENQPVINFPYTGENNDLMVLVACVLFDPMVPSTGLGKHIPKKSQGAYALVATSSYVMEPFQ